MQHLATKQNLVTKSVLCYWNCLIPKNHQLQGQKLKKVVPYSITSVGKGTELIPVFGSQPVGDSHKPGASLPLLSTRPEVTLAAKEVTPPLGRYQIILLGDRGTSQMQNDMPMVMQTRKWKPEVEFQHGIRLFSETGSSNISAVDWGISPKFSLQEENDLPKWAKSPKTKSKVKLRCQNFTGGYAPEAPCWGGLLRFFLNPTVPSALRHCATRSGSPAPQSSSLMFVSRSRHWRHTVTQVQVACPKPLRNGAQPRIELRPSNHTTYHF